MTAAGQRAVELFEQRFSSAPTTVVRAPGRVNVIGEHTDYNDGFVLPAAIDREVWLAIQPSQNSHVEVVSASFDDAVSVALSSWDEKLGGWGAYVQGVAWALDEAGLDVRGWKGAVVSDVPVGAGLSSSAALELAVARAFRVVGGWSWDPVRMAQVCRRAENAWVGVGSGIMDQLASAGGREGHALLLDCRSLAVEPVPLPPGFALVVMDTSTRRELGSSGYDDRRRECEAAAEALGVASLRDVTATALPPPGAVDALLLRRARHVVTENERTLAAAEAMRDGDPARLGRLMSASHRSLRDDFDVSSAALDAVVGIAEDLPGCYGARLTGGGFAGCGVALVATNAAEPFLTGLQDRFEQLTGLRAEAYVCRPVGGAAEDG